MKQKFTSALSLAVIMAMLFTSVGLADEVYADGDNVAPVAQNPLNLGNVCVGDTVSGPVLLAIRRQANVNSDTVFANSSTVTISVGSVSGSGLSAAMGADYTVILPSDWQTAGTGTMSLNTSNSTVSLNATGLPLGAFSGTVQYDGTGNNSNPPPATITRSGTITVNANIVNCMQSQTINVTTSAPSNAVYGSSFNVAATATSGLDVAITTSGSCSGNGDGSAVVTMTSGIGICTVHYNQAGNSSYYPAPEALEYTSAQKANASINVTPYAVTYDGDSHIATGTATGAMGENLSALLNLSGTTHTDAGTYNNDPWSFAGDDNHNSASGTVNDSIAKAGVTATAGGGSATYDGSAKTPSSCAVTGAYTGDLTCTNSPSSVGPDADTYTITPVVSGSNQANFEITPVNGTYEIAKADAVCNISGYTDTYDGQPHGANGTCTGVGGVDLSAGLNLGTSFTDYPGGVAHWTFSGGINYEDQSGDVNITINKAPVTATAGGGSSTYDGTAKSPSMCEVTGAYTGDLTCVNNPLSVGPDAGTYTIVPVVSGTGLGNFEITPVNGSFEIAKAPVTATAGSGSGTYTGFAQIPSACAVSGVYTGDLTCANNPSSVGPDAGTYSIAPVVSGTGLDNYEIAPVSGSYTINKADATIAVSGFSGYYDGASHCATGSATGVLSEDLSAGLNLGSCFTTVPGGTANWTFSGGTNYNDAQGSVAIVINSWSFNGFFQPVDMDKLNTVKGGSTVPLKFEVLAGSTEFTSTQVVKSFVQTRVACDTSAVLDEIEITTTGGTSLRYDAVAGQFVQNWQTPKQAGACYQVTMTTQDGSTLQARFKLK